MAPDTGGEVVDRPYDTSLLINAPAITERDKLEGYDYRMARGGSSRNVNGKKLENATVGAKTLPLRTSKGRRKRNFIVAAVLLVVVVAAVVGGICGSGHCSSRATDDTNPSGPPACMSSLTPSSCSPIVPPTPPSGTPNPPTSTPAMSSMGGPMSTTNPPGNAKSTGAAQGAGASNAGGGSDTNARATHS